MQRSSTGLWRHRTDCELPHKLGRAPRQPLRRHVRPSSRLRGRGPSVDDAGAQSECTSPSSVASTSWREHHNMLVTIGSEIHARLHMSGSAARYSAFKVIDSGSRATRAGDAKHTVDLTL